MKLIKRIFSILMVCLMLSGMLRIGVFAAGTQEEPIDAATKWFGYGVDTYLLNPTIAEGSNGLWYTMKAETAGVLPGRRVKEPWQPEPAPLCPRSTPSKTAPSFFLLQTFPPLHAAGVFDIITAHLPELTYFLYYTI